SGRAARARLHLASAPGAVRIAATADGVCRQMSDHGRKGRKRCQSQPLHERPQGGAAMYYDVTIITVRPGTEQKALARLKETLPPMAGDELLACWYSDIGSLNRILLIRAASDLTRIHAEREKILRSGNPLGVGEYIVGTSVDTYVSFPFMQPLTPRQYGPLFEVPPVLLQPES